jgi:conjugative relaxase-like TrwC/TraI family protein
LSLTGPVTKSEFEAALSGIDPKTGKRLAALGGRLQDHAAGWDMTFSAPKSVSVLWALSEPRDRATIETAQRAAVATAFLGGQPDLTGTRTDDGLAHRRPADLVDQLSSGHRSACRGCAAFDLA